jgi:hypothetical protein
LVPDAPAAEPLAFAPLAESEPLCPLATVLPVVTTAIPLVPDETVGLPPPPQAAIAKSAQCALSNLHRHLMRLNSAPFALAPSIQAIRR